LVQQSNIGATVHPFVGRLTLVEVQAREISIDGKGIYHLSSHQPTKEMAIRFTKNISETNYITVG
jgi:hypothetical protein